MTRKLFLVLLSVLLSIPIVRAQSSQTVNVQTPGTLASLIAGDKNGVTDLTLTGTINATDFATIKGMAKLSVLNMGGATVDNATIPNQAFYGKQYESLVLPEGIKVIGVNAFASANLAELDFSTCPNLSTISDGALSNLKIIKFDFSKCTALETLGRNVFNGTPVDTLDFSNSNKLSNFHYAGSSLACSAHVIIPDSMTQIPANMFNNFTGTVDLPNRITHIGAGAFSNAKLKDGLTLPSSLVYIGVNAFASANLAELDFSTCPNLSTISDGALSNLKIIKFDFSECTALETLGRNVFNGTPVDTLDFSNSNKLSNFHYAGSSLACSAHVIIPDSMTQIPANMFNNFTGTVDLPNRITHIGAGAFSNAKLKDGLTLPSSLVYIGVNAFASANLAELDFSTCPNLSTISDGALSNLKIIKFDFSKCTALETLGRNVFNGTPVDTLDFSNSNKLSNFHYAGSSLACSAHVIIPDSMTQIPANMFNNFTGTVDLPNRITHIGAGAFSNAKLKDGLTLPSSLVYIGVNAFASANLAELDFSTCPNLSTISDGALSNLKIIKFDFSECTALETLGRNVFNGTPVDTLDFSNSNKLSNFHYAGSSLACSAHVIIPDSMTQIPANMFNNFTGTVDLPNRITHIGAGAFSNAKLKDGLTLPSSLVYIGVNAFAASKIDTFVSLAVTPPALGTNVFAFDKTNCVLYVLGESVERYKAANQWKDFLIKPYSNVLTDNMLFEKENGTNLYEVKINETFKVQVFASMVDSLSLGLYINDIFIEDIVQHNEDKNTFVCKISANISDGKYTIQPYTMKDGERKLVSRPLQSHIVDRLPIVVNNWSKSVSRATNVNNHMLLDAGIANLLQVEIGKPFKVYLRHTDATTNVKIGLFDSQNGTLIADVTESVNGDEFTCLISTSRVDANTSYTLIPYNEVSGRVSYIERPSEKPYLIDRLPVYVVGSANAFSSFGVEELAVSATLDPSSGILHFNTQVEKVELYDIMSGTLVKSLIVKGNEISIQELKAGIYVLNIHTTTSKFSQKIKKD